MAEILILTDLLLTCSSFLDRCARLSRRAGFLFYDWLRHVFHRGPEGSLRGWKGSYRENPEGEGVEGSLLSDMEGGGGGGFGKNGR
jgi:hypothetical protein